MILAAIFAGGTGSRMGNADMPKQYLRLGGKPILVHTAEKFLAHPQVERVVVLAPPAWLGFTRDMLDEYLPEGHEAAVAAGGEKRSDTLRRALEYVKARFGDDEDHILLTHDAVRPFVTQRVIGGNIAAAREHGACATAVPSCDTILRSDDGAFLSLVPPRGSMYQAQTPQTFRCNKLRALVDSLRPEEEAALTDACKIYALRGEPVALVPGEARNIKITYPFDLKVAQAILGLEP
ncbi:MAG: 2-C-methyl-D-erythritol 4-phosphate cytidylyltransferase [Oscillospiraceae bacterium]|jgi:2-C-methyl-D-erythritol 4-phosphate cytidylyltransferase|nr:2-C-methyl-D-erythritol 4-phosphate cytidylyltransferase [Oscillospiraceae bacterium]